jgi:hypothetical protein
MSDSSPSRCGGVLSHYQLEPGEKIQMVVCFSLISTAAGGRQPRHLCKNWYAEGKTD